MSEKCDHMENVRAHIAAEEGPKTSRKRDYALRDTVCKANNGWRGHYNRVDLYPFKHAEKKKLKPRTVV